MIKKFLAILFFLPFLASLTIADEHNSTSSHSHSTSKNKKRSEMVRHLAFTNVTVIDATGAPPQYNMTVITLRNKIVGMGKTNKQLIPSTAKVFDATGKYMIPGLWDMHTHISYPSYTNGHDRHEEVMLPLLVVNGVLGIRDMGGEWEVLQEWREKIKEGKLLGPQIVASSLNLDGNATFESTITVSTPKRAREVVQKFAEEDVDFIKTQSLLSREVFFAIADETKKQGLPLVGHVPFKVTLSEAVDAGLKSIEHLTGALYSKEEIPYLTGVPYSERAHQENFLSLMKHGVWQVPTMTWLHKLSNLKGIDTSHDPRLKYIPEYWKTDLWDYDLEQHQKGRTEESRAKIQTAYLDRYRIIRKMRDAGVRFLAGTDLGAPYIFPGFSLHDELKILVQAGLSPMEALQSATRNPAEYFGKLKTLGTVEKRKEANLVLLDANPLEDIGNTQKIHAVVYRGQHFSRQTLDKFLIDIEYAAKKQ